tara:strand:- start:5106 stop:5249 length:144 start_codon:yes stop_codon:yes gene_type:complete
MRRRAETDESTPPDIPTITLPLAAVADDSVVDEPGVVGSVDDMGILS